jgi:hypothetical protein
MDEAAYLRRMGVPDEGTPERAAWDLVLAWVWDDGEYDHPPRVGQVISEHYPKLIERIAELSRDRDRQLAEARAIIERFVDDDPCHYDHDDFCQTHYNERPCNHELARVFLRDFDG